MLRDCADEHRQLLSKYFVEKKEVGEQKGLTMFRTEFALITKAIYLV